MGSHPTLWSFTASEYVTPSAIQLQSTCTHAPLSSVTLSPLAGRSGQQHGTALPLRRLQQLGLKTYQRTEQRQQQQDLHDAATEWPCNGGSHGRLPRLCDRLHAGGITTAFLQTGGPGSMASFSEEELLDKQREHLQRQWHWQHQHQHQLGQQPLQRSLNLGTAGVAVVPANAAVAVLAEGDASSNSSSRADSGQHAQIAQPPVPAVATQPKPLYQLIAAAKRKHALPPGILASLLSQLQPFLMQLPFDQLAWAAWAVAQLSERGAPSTQWQEQLLQAASSHFAVANSISSTSNNSSSSSGSDIGSSSSIDEASVATLLQALVKLQLQPPQAWLASCCNSMALERWHSPQALSTVAACLPQLKHVPSSSWADSFFMASAAGLQAFPGISLARMLHGVVAWRHLQFQHWQQQQQQSVKGGDGPNHINHLHGQQALVFMPDSWVLDVLQSLCRHSTQLKPAEIAMVLQSMHRLDQQTSQQQQPSSQATQQQGMQTALLPAQGQPAGSPTQQVAMQLLQALLAGTLQQLDKFHDKDLTVMLFAVSALQEARVQQYQVLQQQQHLPRRAALCPGTTSWSWLQRVLTLIQGRLSRMDARGQATCLVAASMLVQPHLALQQHQQEAAMVLTAQLQQQAVIQQVQQQQQAGIIESPGQPKLVKPLHRWLQQQMRQQQQQQQQLQPLSEAPTAVAPADSISIGVAETQDAASVWQQWLSIFFIASGPCLHHYTGEDLTVTACCLANMQHVPPVSWYGAYLAAVQGQLPHLSPGQVSGIAWALARLTLLPMLHNASVSLVPSTAWMQRLYSAVSPASGRQGAAAEPQLRTARVAQQAAAARATEPAVAAAVLLQQGLQPPMRCSAAELARLMWAAGMCGFDPGDSWWAGAGQQLLQQGTQQCSQHQQQQLLLQHGCLPTRLLGAVVQAYAAVGRQIPDSLLQSVILTPATQRQLVKEPVINTVRLLRGLQQGKCSPPRDWLQQLVMEWLPRLPLLGPDELPQLLTALAAVIIQPAASNGSLEGMQDAGSSNGVYHVMPRTRSQRHVNDSVPSQWPKHQQSTQSSTGSAGQTAQLSFAPWRDELLCACQQLLPRLSATGISSILWAAARLQLKPPVNWLEAMLQRLQTQFMSAKPAALAQAVDALSRLGYKPSGDWLAAFFMATHRKFAAVAGQGKDYNDRRQLVHVMLQTLWGLAGLPVPVPPRWLKLVLVLIHSQLPVLQPRHVSLLLLSLARLQCRPSTLFLQKLLDHLGDCSSCSSLDLVHLIYAVATLRWQPNKQWVTAYLWASASKMTGMSPRGLGLMHWALAVIRVVPPKPWRRVAVAAVATQLQALDAQALSMVLWAWGRMMVHLVRKHSKAHAGRASKQRQLLWMLQHYSQQQKGQQLKQQQEQQQPQLTQPVGQHQEPGRRQQQQGSSLHEDLSDVNSLLVANGHELATDVYAAAWRLRGSFSAAGLVHLLVGVAKMQLQPDQAWLGGMVLQGSPDKLSALDGYQLQQFIWALARLGFTAPEGWLRTVSVLLEVRWQHQASTRHSADWALGRLQQLAKLSSLPASVQPSHAIAGSVDRSIEGNGMVESEQ